MQGVRQRGALGLAQGVADGVWGLAISPVAATLEAGTMVLSTVEAAALGTGGAGPPRQAPTLTLALTLILTLT